MTQHSATQRQSHRGGMSLVELTIAMLISCIILAGMSAPLYLALESNNAAVTPDAAALESARVLADISGELQYALAVTKQLPTECEFTVPDRDNDSAPETINLKWGGKSGDALTRKVNSGDKEVLVDNVYLSNFQRLIWIDGTRAGTWINGNTFDHLTLGNAYDAIYVDATGGLGAGLQPLDDVFETHAQVTQRALKRWSGQPQTYKPPGKDAEY